MSQKEPMKYWIRTTVHYCPPCGSEDRYRERMPLPKPTNWEERYIWKQVYDWCEG